MQEMENHVMRSVVIKAYFARERDSKLQQKRSCLLFVRKLQVGPALRKVIGIFAHTNTQTRACYGYDQWDAYPASCSATSTDPSYARICSCVSGRAVEDAVG